MTPSSVQEIAELNAEDLARHSKQVWDRLREQLPEEVQTELGAVIGTMSTRLEYAGTGASTTPIQDFVPQG